MVMAFWFRFAWIIEYFLPPVISLKKDNNCALSLKVNSSLFTSS